MSVLQSRCVHTPDPRRGHEPCMPVFQGPQALRVYLVSPVGPVTHIDISVLCLFTCVCTTKIRHFCRVYLHPSAPCVPTCVLIGKYTLHGVVYQKPKSSISMTREPRYFATSGNVCSLLRTFTGEDWVGLLRVDFAGIGKSFSPRT